jgi:hypothetical protein
MRDDVNKRSRNWLLTIDAHEQDGLPTISMDQVSDSIKDLDSEADYVFQLERGGKTDYLHYQVAVLCSRGITPPRRQDVLRRFKAHGIADAHAEAAIKTGIDIAGYCSKSRTRMGDTQWSSDEFMTTMMSQFRRGRGASRQGSRDDLQAIKDAIDEGMTPIDLIRDPSYSVLMAGQAKQYAESYYGVLMMDRCSRSTREVKVHYIFGRTGSGKTRYVYDRFGYEHVYTADCGGRDPFSRYDYEPVLVLDEFRSSVRFNSLLRMLDRYPFQIDRRYHNSWAAWTDVYMLTTIPLRAQYPDVEGSEREQLYRRITDVSEMVGGSLRPLGSGLDIWNGTLGLAS